MVIEVVGFERIIDQEQAGSVDVLVAAVSLLFLFELLQWDANATRTRR